MFVQMLKCIFNTLKNTV